MCVQTSELLWEGPAEISDLPILGDHFPRIDFKSMLEAMSVYGFQPLTTDLVLMAGMLSVNADELGAKYLPFAGIDPRQPSVVVKLPVMKQIIGWAENTALGTDMWNAVSDWAEERYDVRVHFAMDCGCGLVPKASYTDGRWATWLERFNTSRSKAYGRTTIVWRDTDDIKNIDITPNQLMIWRRMRAALEALPARRHQTNRQAA